MEDLAALHRLMLVLLSLRDMEGELLLLLLLLLRHRDMVVGLQTLLPLYRDMVVEPLMPDRVDMAPLQLNQLHDMEAEHLLVMLEVQAVTEHL